MQSKDDDLIIETALKGKAQYLITRDDDVKADKKVLGFLSKAGVVVLSVNKLIALI